MAACSDDGATTGLSPTDGPLAAAGSNAGANLDQWGNGAPPPTGEAWQNGNLNGNNSAYGEGKVVPFRLAIEGLTAKQHVITIQQDFTAGGHKAYDFITNADATEKQVFAKICGTGGGGVSTLCAGSTGPMPSGVPYVDVDLLTDAFEGAPNKTVDGAIAVSSTKGTRKFRVYGVANSGDVLISQVSHAGTLTGGSTSQFVVTFTPKVAGPVLMVWGGHLAESGYWDGTSPNGASTISGAPWHMRTLNLDGGGAANQDRSIQPSALVKPVLAVTKVANPVGPVTAGGTIGFDVVVQNNGPGTVFNVAISDLLPAAPGVNWTTPTPECQITGVVPNQTLSCAVNSILEAASFTARVTSPTAGTSCSAITNTGASASATNALQVTSGPASVTILCQPNVSLSKSADAVTVSAGSQIGFFVTVNNAGAGTATDVNLTDALPAGTGVSWSLAAPVTGWSITGVPPNQVLKFNATSFPTGSASAHVVSATTLESCKAYANTASATVGAGAPAPEDVHATTTVQCPNVSLSKSADASSVNAGQQIGFFVTVNNAGPGTATGVDLTDPLPAGTGVTWSLAAPVTGWSITGLPPNQVLKFNATSLGVTSTSAHVISGTTSGSCKTYDNTASATLTNGATPQNVSASTTVNCADIQITKTADAASVNAGDAIGFTMTVTNGGAGTASGVTLTDVLPTTAGTSWSISPAVTGCSITAGTLTCTFGDLAAGASQAVHISSPTTAASCGSVANTARVSTTNDGSAQAPASVLVKCPTVGITKTADAATVSAGAQIGFTVKVSNTGPGVASNVGVNDALPLGTGVDWSIAAPSTGWSITGTAPGQQTLVYSAAALGVNASSEVHVVSATTAASCKAYSNTATATLGNGTAPQPASATTTVQCPNVSLSKSADAVTVSAGSQIGFYVTLNNPGPGIATNVVVNDPLPAGTGVAWSIETPVTGWTIAGSVGSQVLAFNGPSFGVGSSSVHVISATTGASCKAYANTATATLGNGTAPPPASATTTVQCPSVSLTKTADAPSVSAGSQIGFTVTVSNAGPGIATNVNVSDLLPAGTGVSWSLAAQSTGWSIVGLPPSQTLQFNATTLAVSGTSSVHVVSGTTLASCKSYDNTASATVGNGPAPQNASASVTVNCAQIKIAKTADAATANAGDPIGFTMTVTNTGAGTAMGVTLTDVLPATAGTSWSISTPVTGCVINGGTLTCNFGDLATSGSKSVHISSPTTFASCGTVSNTGSVSTTNDGSDESQASVLVKCPALAITKIADAASVSAGSAIGFTIQVSNTGAGTAKAVTLSDPLPTGTGISWSIDPAVSGCSITSNTLTCNFGDLTTGTSSKSVHVSSPTTGASCGTYANTASAQASNHAQVQASASTIVNCAAIGIEKVADAGTVSAGDVIGFTMTVKNTGTGTATGVTLTDVLPTTAGTSWSIATSVTGCAISGGTLTCNFGDLATGASKSVHVTSPTTSASCGSVTNKGTVTTTNDGSGDSQAAVTVQCPTLTLVKAADAATVNAGAPIGFTVTVGNTGPGVAANVGVNDPLPLGTGINWSIATPSSGWSITGTAPGQQTLVYSAATLGVNAPSSVHVVSNTTAASCKPYNNTASATLTNGTAPQNASASTTVQCPSLRITKTPDQAGNIGYAVQPGGTATFTVTVSNTGSGTATNVVLTDTLPAGLTWTNDRSCPIGSVTVNTVSRQRMICAIPPLAGGASYTVQVSALVPSGFLLQPPAQGTGVLEIDGDLISNGGLDWANGAIDCQSNPKVGCDIDKATGTTDDSFGQGTKEDTSVPSVVAGSIPNNKSDLLRFYVKSNRVGTDDYLYLAWERVQAPTGTTNMDFELNQSSVRSANGVTPERTAGDILIKYDLAKGGSVPELGFHTWVTTASAGGQTPAQKCEASSSFPCWGKLTSLINNPKVAGAINGGSVTDPIRAAGQTADRSLDALTFGEASINLQAAGIFQAGVCVNFGQAYLKSRSSDSFTAEIKDFIAPLPVSVSNCPDKLLDNTAWVQADGVGPTWDTGQIKVTNSGGTASLYTAPGSNLLARADVSAAMPTVVAAADLVTTDVGTSAADPFEPTGRGEALRPREVWTYRPAQAGRGSTRRPPADPRAHRAG